MGFSIPSSISGDHHMSITDPKQAAIYRAQVRIYNTPVVLVTAEFINAEGNSQGTVAECASIEEAHALANHLEARGCYSHITIIE
jgi:hypothetical protein